MRHRLYKNYSTRKWADAFLDGKLRFNSLAYFRDFEDVQVRGDKNEGKMIFRPEDGLVITNQTQGWTRTIPRALNATVKQEEIFVFWRVAHISANIAPVRFQSRQRNH
jgi:hypothetical protein